MKLHNVIKATALLCLSSLSMTSNAEDSTILNSEKQNYSVVKAGIIQPTTLRGNSNLNIGDTTYTYGIVAGRKFIDQFGVELEYMHRAHNTTNNTSANHESLTWGAKSDTVMLNFSADMIKDSKIRPYVKFGIGGSRNQASNYVEVSVTPKKETATYNGKTTNSFAWQVGAGLDIYTDLLFITQIQYMFVNRGKIETSSGTVASNGGVVQGTYNGKLQDHVITLGVGIRF